MLKLARQSWRGLDCSKFFTLRCQIKDYGQINEYGGLGLQMEFLRSALVGSFWLSTYGEDYISAFSQQVQKIVMVPWKTLSLRTSLDLQLSYMMKKQLVVLTVSSQKANPIKKRNQLWVKIFSLFLPVSSLHAILFSCVKRES